MSATFSFPKNRRLQSSADFRRVFKRRQKVGGQHGSLHLAKNGLGCSRLGITVSKRVSKRAVQRNRIKRRVREYFRHHPDCLPDTDLVFTAYPGCAEMSNIEMDRMLGQLFARAEKRCKACS